MIVASSPKTSYTTETSTSITIKKQSYNQIIKDNFIMSIKKGNIDES